MAHSLRVWWSRRWVMLCNHLYKRTPADPDSTEPEGSFSKRIQMHENKTSKSSWGWMVTLAFKVLFLQAQPLSTFQLFPPGPLVPSPRGRGTAPWIVWQSHSLLPDTCGSLLHKAEWWWLYGKGPDGEGGAVNDAAAPRLRESCLHNFVGHAPSALPSKGATPCPAQKAWCRLWLSQTDEPAAGSIPQRRQRRQS